MSAKRGLGRGFDSLIPTELLDESFDPTANQDDKVSDLRHIKISEIHPDPDQPRRTFDDVSLGELAQSIKLHGILQPIVVTPRKGGGYMIVAGERRYRASKIAGIDKLPALVRTLTNQHKLELSLIENLQRQDLNLIETATAYLKLRDQFSMTLDQISERVGGRSISSISNRIRLLRLPAFVKELIADGTLGEGSARPLIGLDEKTLKEIIPIIIKEQWGSRRIEQYITQLRALGDEVRPEKIKAATKMPYEKEVKALNKRFQMPISVTTNAKGAGRLVIKFKNAEEFEKLQKMLG